MGTDGGREELLEATAATPTGALSTILDAGKTGFGFRLSVLVDDY